MGVFETGVFLFCVVIFIICNLNLTTCTVVFPTRRSKILVLPSLLGVGQGERLEGQELTCWPLGSHQDRESTLAWAGWVGTDLSKPTWTP